MNIQDKRLRYAKKRAEKIKFIIEQEMLANNSWTWVKYADEKTINELYDYWTQEENPNE